MGTPVALRPEQPALEVGTACGPSTKPHHTHAAVCRHTQSHQSFDPWGQIKSGAISATTLNYTGQRLDGTGLLYYHARMYDPVLARFVSADSIAPKPENPQTRNRYSYVLNNPIRYTDPSGHCSESAAQEEEKGDARAAENTACRKASDELGTYGYRILNLNDWLSARANALQTFYSTGST